MRSLLLILITGTLPLSIIYVAVVYNVLVYLFLIIPAIVGYIIAKPTRVEESRIFPTEERMNELIEELKGGDSKK